MPARCRPARENAAGDVQIPQRQWPCSAAQNSGDKQKSRGGGGGGMKDGEGERLWQQRDPGIEAPNARFNGNNKLLSQAIKSAFDTYLRAEVHCAI
eukprot:superscaffoldBa00002028_g12923